MKTVAVILVSVFIVSCGLNTEINNKVDLGKELFFDKILSEDKTISCASCHKPEFAFADNEPTSKGVHGLRGTRNTPSCMNMASREHFFWDGRAATLEEQALGPIENPVEMNLSIEEAIERLNASEKYVSAFNKLYFSNPTESNLANALAEFQRSLEGQGETPHDRWINDEKLNPMTPSQVRGRELFMEDGKCFDCHFGPDFTGDEFRNIGLYDANELTDMGRFDFTKDSTDIGKFKTPGLRNVELTAPYMHNGMFKTLEEVIDYYDNPYNFVRNPIGMDSLMIEPLNLTEQEKTDLVNFLKSLTDDSIPYIDD
jgi:cytochrome c peroxidase